MRRLISSTIRIICRAVSLVRLSSFAKSKVESGCPSWPPCQTGRRGPSAPAKLRIMPTTWMTGVFLGMTLTLTSESGGKWPGARARKTAGAAPGANNPIASTTGRAFMVSNLLHLVAGRVVGAPLKCQELVNCRDRHPVVRRHPHFAAARPVVNVVRYRGPARPHHVHPRHDLRVDRERLGEVARPKRRLNVTHVGANGLDPRHVGGIVAVQHHAAAVG